VGDVQTAAVLELIERHFGDWRGPQPEQSVPPAPPLHEVRRVSVPLPDKIQTDLMLGGPAVPRRHPDFYAVRVANTVLGRFGMMGRLGERVREEEGLAYYVYSTQDAGEAAGAWLAAAGVNPAHVDQAIASILDEFARLREEPVPDAELADSQAYMTGVLPLTLETNEGVAATLLNMEYYKLGLDYLERYDSLINSVTAADVQRVARAYLRPEAYVLALAGPGVG
jgi:zinc protease